jgi:general secretion pathway protein I
VTPAPVIEIIESAPGALAGSCAAPGGHRLARGFTLLEVMIALAILSIGLVALADLNGGAVQLHAYARRATQATLLLRGKMLDLEELLTKDGFSDFDDEKHGTFEDEGAPEYAWRAEILKPKIELGADQLLGMLGVGGKGGSGSGSSSSGSSGSSADPSGLLGTINLGAGLLGGAAGGSGSGGSMLAGGLAAAGPMAGIIQGQAKTFIETLKKSVREVRITVTWKDGAVERTISASQQIVILPDSVGKAGTDLSGVAGATGPVRPTVVNGQSKGPSGDGSSSQ